MNAYHGCVMDESSNVIKNAVIIKAPPIDMIFCVRNMLIESALMRVMVAVILIALMVSLLGVYSPWYHAARAHTQ